MTLGSERTSQRISSENIYRYENVNDGIFGTSLKASTTAPNIIILRCLEILDHSYILIINP